MSRNLNRLEGRLFTESGTLFMVVHADEANNQAQVSFRVNEETQVLDLPFSEAAARVAKGANLILDNLNSPESAKRILEMKDGWYFASREGEMGPYDSREEAGQNLGRYILSMQEIGRTSREPEPQAQGARRAAAH
jgi:hypothetical protein